MTTRFVILSIFPEIFDSFLECSLIGKAVAGGKVGIDRMDIRQFSTDLHRSVDDEPYGGGTGMVMTVQPVADALRAAPDGHKVLLTPQGERCTQKLVRELARYDTLVLVCGRYEGFDDRIRRYVDREVSIGDFVLNGGEVGAMAIMESVLRLKESVLGNPMSLQEESFNDGLLEYPQYTRPRQFDGKHVPEVLLGGNHAEISRWRRKMRLWRTSRRRPDLLERMDLCDEDAALLAEAEQEDGRDGS